MTSIRHIPALLAGIFGVLANRLLLRSGLRRRRDGWRRGAGLVLRGEAATFVLSAFALDVWSDRDKPQEPSNVEWQNHVSERLAGFLANKSDFHVCIQRGELEDRVAHTSGPTYTLAFQPWIEGASRFVRPDRWNGSDHSTQRADSSDVLLNIVCRIGPHQTVDVWVRFNHVGIDGVLAQELITQLEADWGRASHVIFPTPEEFAGHSGPHPCAGREGLAEMQAFVDFSPLIEWRKKQNARLSEPMTLSAAIIWCLAQHGSLPKISIGTTVDVPPTDGLGRGVGVVAIRPADFADEIDPLSQFVRHFNRELDLTRRRASTGCKTLDAAALISPRLGKTLLVHALQGDRAFGSMGLTVLRDASVFGAPMGDAGHPDGFIAIGSVTLPCGDGRKVGCITIKGPPARIASYPRVIQEAIQLCAIEPRPASFSLEKPVA